MRNQKKDGCGWVFPRFTPCRDMYVFHNEIGMVLDIGMDGLSFVYVADNDPPETFPAEGMVFSSDGRHIQGIPFEIVSDHMQSRFFSSDYFVRERRIRFGELSIGLVTQLECFILKYAHIPQLSFDTRYVAHKSVYASAEEELGLAAHEAG